MKLTIIGAAGVRTPLIVKEIINRQNQLGISQLFLMDIDPERLDLIATVTAPIESTQQAAFTITRTTDPKYALTDADYVITTFRVGGMPSRIIDERVPLSFGFLGQETTGPGGFAMGLRSIPVLLEYLDQMRIVCPNAWLINFANPSGMLTEAAHIYGKWDRAIGICDGPSSMLQLIAQVLGLPSSSLWMEYFGLNHLGWIRSVTDGKHEFVPEIISLLVEAGGFPGFHIDPKLVACLGMIPNEYLYYYYYSKKSVSNIIQSKQTRGETVSALNENLFAELKTYRDREDFEGMSNVYNEYISARSMSYMNTETGKENNELLSRIMTESADLGYARMALDLIESLETGFPRQLTLNIPNQSSISGMSAEDIVEIPVNVTKQALSGIEIGSIPDHCLGLMKSIKAYEKLTIDAAVTNNYEKAVTALTIHPLVGDFASSQQILDEYLAQHGTYFPKLTK